MLLVYRPPKGDMEYFFEKMREVVQSLPDKDEVIIMGDMNIDYLGKKTLATSKLYKWEKDLLLSQIIKSYTRVCESSQSCIDLMFTNINFISEAGVINLHLSDHKPIFLIKKKGRNEAKPIKLKTRGTIFDYDLLENELKAVDWSYVAMVQNPSILWDRMFGDIMQVVNKLNPLREFTVKNNRPNYLNDEIIKLGKERDAAFEKAIITKSKDDWELAVKARRKANSGVRKSKYNYIQGNIDDSEGDPKRFWHQVRLLIPNVKSQLIDYVMAEDGVTALRGVDACDRINSYFCNVSCVLAAKFGPIIPDVSIDYNCSDPEIWDFYVTKDEVLDLVKEIAVNKSSGFIDISSSLMKMVLTIIIDQFVLLLNLILSKSIFPNAWKTAITTVIPKPGNCSLVENLRPISLVPITGKIMEKIINSIIMDYLENNDKLFERQGGFRKGKSTVKTTHDLVNHLLLNKNKGMTSAAVFIDIAKAFNCLNHVLLLNKLKVLGFSPSLVDLIGSYLGMRKQVVKLNGFLSEEDLIIDGIPQGSNLGPTLFLIYMNDLMHIKFRGFLNLYADDSSIAVSSKDIHRLCTDLNYDLELFYDWCSRNRLTINVKKTKIVIFKKSRSSNVSLGNVYLNGQIIQTVPEYVYLGFVLDENLSFQNHAKKLIQASNIRVYTLAKIRRFINCETAVRIFKTFILPKI